MTITARGVGLLAGRAVLLAAGFRFGYPELAVLGAAAASRVALRRSATRAWRPRLTVTAARRPGPGGPRRAGARVTLTVRNTGRLRRGDPGRRGPLRRPATVPVPLLRLRPGRDTDGQLPGAHRTAAAWSRRSAAGHPPRPARAGRRWPARTARPREVWVHPRIHPLRAVPAGVARSLDGARRPGAARLDHLRLAARVRHRRRAAPGALADQRQGRRADGPRTRSTPACPGIVVLLDDRAGAHPRPRRRGGRDVRVGLRGRRVGRRRRRSARTCR